MVKVDIIDEDDNIINKGRDAFIGFKDFNQNTNTEIQLLEKNPCSKDILI